MGNKIVAILISLAAVILGIVVAGFLIGLIQFAGHRIFPLPEGLDVSNPEAIKAAMKNIPPQTLLPVLVSYALGTFGGGAVAALISRHSHKVHALVVGAVMLAAGVINLVTIPHPMWFNLAAVLVFLPAAWFGAQVVRGRI